MIETFEEHSEVSALWGSSTTPYSGGRVVCFDRHLDLKALSPSSRDEISSAWGQSGTFEHLVRALPIRYAVGAFGLDDFWSAASAAGLLRHLVWVTPELGAGRDWRRSALQTVSMIPNGPSFSDLELGENHLRARCFGLTLDVVPLQHLALYWQAWGWDSPAIDVDLDWLVTSHHELEHDVATLADAIRLLDGELTAMTWSQRSGFTAPRHRYLADSLSESLGVQRRDSSFLPAASSVQALLNPTLEVQEGQLNGVPPGIRDALLGQRALERSWGDAADRYWSAYSRGTHANALAYGLSHASLRAGRWNEAKQWATRSIVDDPYDTVASHAHLVRVVATARSGSLAEAYSDCVDLMDLIPLRSSLRPLARSLSTPENANHFSELSDRFREQDDILRSWLEPQ